MSVASRGVDDDDDVSADVAVVDLTGDDDLFMPGVIEGVRQRMGNFDSFNSYQPIDAYMRHKSSQRTVVQW